MRAVGNVFSIPLNGRELENCLTLALGDWVKRIWSLKPQNTHFKSQVHSTQLQSKPLGTWGQEALRLNGQPDQLVSKHQNDHS